MTRQSLTRIVAGIAVAGVVGLAASPAFATTSSSPPPRPNGLSPTGQSPTGQLPTGNQAAILAKIKADADAAIQGRLTALHAVIGALGGVPSTCDVGALIATANADIAGLTALDVTIQADTTVQQARTDAQKTFTQFRVFALAIPVDHMVRATCEITDVAAKLTTLATKWSGLDDASIAALLSDMQAKTLAATQAINGLAGTLEQYVPSGWNPGLLAGARGSLKTARQDLETARLDARKIVAILHGEHRSAGPSTANPTTSTTAAA